MALFIYKLYSISISIVKLSSYYIKNICYIQTILIQCMFM